MVRQRIRESASKWLTKACVSAVFGGLLLPGQILAQSDSSSAPKTSSTKAAPKTGPKTGSKKSTSAKTPATKSSASAHSKSGTTVARNTKSKRSSGKRTGKKTARGQQKIDPQRAEAIQEALIREHYLSGGPAGTWNQASEDALRKYQADHGWQSKQVPDSRALISLGLGPSHDGLLNPESAMTTGPDVSHSASATATPQAPTSHSAEPRSVPANTSQNDAPQ